MKTVLALFLVLTVVTVRSQVPKPCVAPSAMEARIVEIDPSRGFEVRAKMSYDFYNRRVRIVDEVVHSDSRKEFMDVLFLHDVRNMEREYEVRAKMSYDARNLRKRYVDEVFINGDKRDYYDVLYLHNVGKEYRLNFQTKVCEVLPISREFRPIGIPLNGTFYGEATIGSKAEHGEGVNVQAWGGDAEFGRYIGVWTLTGCLPVREGYYSNQTGFINTEFFDITLGISDPNVFIPPQECIN
ncbi:mammalian ependymin-related protein 1-like isoform X2 [Anneissia japonica]|uniref:mammalian ependymin-related protein 1-like isoform X2 n=1 Tax=Anneissia japonica TaxID=1529436 RepID=UPI001425597B|nr:mammalian ependymin-related protein 1-like isoform X2 [Anneissia japonica]